ncbi:hypothetical protein HN385_05935 [archaeon]|nr:hypothetical protein [archaeon]MBT3451102.1 hypothetical protein [archaeon]MBT6868654.1 hypothetical protein [archaeon]MBT7193379.1 hypothetical protein [archaeon]MBT7381451.1 hypothetical protein [archaeon]
MISLDKLVGVDYDNFFGDGDMYRFEVESDLPKAVTSPEYEKITEIICSEFGKSKNDYQCLMYKRDLDGDPINFSMEKTSGWIKVINGIKTQAPINGDYKSLKNSGITTHRPDVAQRIIELFEQDGYKVKKRYE